MPTQGFPHRSIPVGWFQVGWSDELAVPGADVVRKMRYFGQDLVMYRAQSGQVVVLDAYCPHMGAHLGYGGTVCGDAIACPYHGWQWGPEGKNALIPYAERTSSRKLRSWPVREMGGLIMVWHHPQGAPPAWDLPEIAEASDPAYCKLSPQAYHHWPNLQMPAQLVTENAVDPVHFKYVHGNAEVGTAESFSAEGPIFRAVTKLMFGSGREKTWLTPNGPMLGSQDFTVHGLGLFLTRFPDTDQALQIDCATPIDIDTSDRRVSLFVRRTPGETGDAPTGNGSKRVRAAIKLAAQDFPIWENLKYNTKPLLTPEEAPAQLAIRRWAQQFYLAAEAKSATPVTTA